MLAPKLVSAQLPISKTTPQYRLGVRLILTKTFSVRIHRNRDAKLPFRLPLRPHGGEVSSRRRKGVELGAGDETMTRYPQTGDFITNVSARRDGDGYTAPAYDI